jgi:hypothetical protein
MTENLKLRAVDDEDLQVLSAVLQDALIPVGEMAYLPTEQRFVMVANRFKWENCSESADQPRTVSEDRPMTDAELTAEEFNRCASYERVLCGVCFDGVEIVKRRGVEQHDRTHIHELLALRSEPGAVVLVFAGGAALRLEGRAISCRIEDLGEPYPTTWRPQHTVGGAA